MKLRYIIIAFLCQMAILSNAQTQPDIEAQKVIPPTPNAASLGKYGNIPIGLYTGQPNVNFSLFQIEYNDITIPINLSYNYSGLKVEEYPSWVGTGWTLGGTGVINRQVKGLPDESKDGYNGQNQLGLQTVGYIANPNRTTYQSFLDGVSKGLKDSEPDMFVLSLPGLSGKFFFDETQCNSTIKQAVVIPHQKLKIVGHFNYTATYNYKPGIIVKFVVTDEKGIVYTFDVIEKSAGSEPGDPDSEDFANTWYLSSILTPNGNTIGYQYKSRVIDMPATINERRIVPVAYPMPPNLVLSNLYSSQFTWSHVTEYVLEKITFRDGWIDFVEGDVRLDWNPSSWTGSTLSIGERPKTLSRIRIMTGGKLLKEVEFSYGYFNSDARLRLDSFREVNGVESKPPHLFEYHSGAFPSIGNEYSLYQQDHWGFYTGLVQSTLLPPFNEAIQRLDGSVINITIPGNNRNPVSSASKAGLLNKITYPTKGYTQFEYEPNKYWRTSSQDFNLCSGNFRQHAMATTSVAVGDTYDIQTITLATSTCIRLDYLLSTPCIDGYAGFTLLNGSEVLVEHSQEKRSFGNNYIDIGPGNGETLSLGAGTYTLTAMATNENSCGASTSALVKLFKIEQDIVGAANVEAGGWRVSKVKDCLNDQNCITSLYEYAEQYNPSQSSGRLINSPVYKYYQTILFDDNGDGLGATSLVPLSCANIVANSEVPLASTSGGVVGYRFVRVREGVDSVKGFTEYKYTSPEEFPDEGNTSYPFPPRISNDWKRGAQLSKTDFRYSNPFNQKIGAQDNTYSYNGKYDRLLGLKPYKGRDSRSSAYILTLDDYNFYPYKVNSGWISLKTQQDTQYDYAGGTQKMISHTKNLYYENPIHMLVTKMETFSSKGDTLKTTMKYIEDVDNVSGLTLTEKGGIGSNPNKTSLVEQQEFNGSKLLSTTRKLYNGSNLSKVQYSTSSNQLEDYVTYNQYDAFGNVLKYTTLTGQTNSYLWGYNNKLPVMEVKNAEVSDVFYSSFEETGVIEVDAGGRNLAYSGRKVMNSGTFSFPVTFSPTNPANTFMTYFYWQNNKWNFSGVVPFTTTITTTGVKLDEVRAFPKGAQMTTYTYDPSIGVSSVTDINSVTSNYEYDAFGRLKLIRNDKGEIEKQYLYKYKGN